MKRCKNCRLWRVYRGNEPTVPRHASRACVLRLHFYKNGHNEDRVSPSLLMRDPPGPHFGKRTGPNFVCEFFAAHQAPVVGSEK